MSVFTAGHVADRGAVNSFSIYLAVCSTFALGLFPRQQKTECAEEMRLAAPVQLMPVLRASIVHLRIWEQKRGVVSCHPRPIPVKG